MYWPITIIGLFEMSGYHKDGLVRRSQGIKSSDRVEHTLLQLRVLGFRSDENGNIGVGVLPQFQEVLEGFSSSRRVARERGGARQPQVGKRVELPPIGVLPSTAPIGALVIQDFFELSRCLSAFTEAQVSQAPQVRRIGVSTLVRRGGCQQFHGFGGLIALERDRSANRG